MSATGGTQAHWATRFGFIMAAIGSAVGLGNFWRFPYLTGENGGGAFVLVYLLSILVIILPLLIAEFVIGRRGQTSAVSGIAKVADANGASRAWGLVGLLGILATFLILTFYSVIGGWVLSYISLAAQGAFTGASPDSVAATFGAMLADPMRLLVNHALFMALTAGIVMLGVNRGLETVSVVMMPLLLVLLLVLVVYAAVNGDFARGLSFLFVPDLAALTPAGVSAAIAQGFFSVGITGALMVTYAGYAQRSFNLGGSALLIVVSDTVIALLAGLAIFPVVFSHGLDPAGGPGLTFVTLPISLGDLPGATVMASVFFVLLLVAAITSSISLLELPVAEAQARGLPRILGVLIFGGLAFALGIATVYSFNVWAEVFPLSFVPGLETKTIFDLIDDFTSKVMLPLAGLFVALFAGYVLRPEALAEELGWQSRLAINALRLSLMVVTPTALLFVF